ncbi:(2Fe-2S)-binding protein [Mycolicibacterium madagascariense]|uniref:(2Fe-2S)-binding protein n=1 Tax=Mycolicibacterium madagascariense TaxID=212765 RepID=UPI0013D12C46|nr:(2Fe-2S)-binding protein [Mycolicibacterium madagascariense]MCV7011720.1 (2Fe-2S)-binding protein [Mycolicibacterium madagascariense]
MYVCLCRAVTSQTVRDVIAAGASTSRQIAEACGAGAECGRCRRSVRTMIDAMQQPGHDVEQGLER